MNFIHFIQKSRRFFEIFFKNVTKNYIFVEKHENKPFKIFILFKKKNFSRVGPCPFQKINDVFIFLCKICFVLKSSFAARK